MARLRQRCVARPRLHRLHTTYHTTNTRLFHLQRTFNLKSHFSRNIWVARIQEIKAYINLTARTGGIQPLPDQAPPHHTLLTCALLLPQYLNFMFQLTALTQKKVRRTTISKVMHLLCIKSSTDNIVYDVNGQRVWLVPTNWAGVRMRLLHHHLHRTLF